MKFDYWSLFQLRSNQAIPRRGNAKHRIKKGTAKQDAQNTCRSFQHNISKSLINRWSSYMSTHLSRLKLFSVKVGCKKNATVMQMTTTFLLNPVFHHRNIFHIRNTSTKNPAIRNGMKQLTNVFMMYEDSANKCILKSLRKQSNETIVSEDWPRISPGERSFLKTSGY